MPAANPILQTPTTGGLYPLGNYAPTRTTTDNPVALEAHLREQEAQEKQMVTETTRPKFGTENA